MAGAGGQAFAQDSQRLWGAWGELGAQAGAETNAFLEGFMPIGQDADSIVFLDMRLDYGENSRGSTSLGLGIREIVGPDLILGANVFVDAVRTENSNTFAGATLGLEAFTSIFDLRINAHVPIGGRTRLSPIVSGDGVSVVNNQLVENRTRVDRKEGLLSGLTGEIGAMFDSPFADNQRLRAYAGGYIYDRDGFDTESGGRLGLEYQINDVLSLAGSRFTLGAELVYDKDDEFDAIASARLRIPLFSGAQSRGANGESRLSAIQQRMDEGVRRDKGIRVGTSSSTTAVNGVPVINPATGNPYGGIYYADQGGGGTGDFADPASLATAVANAGTDGIVIALGGGGPISTSGVTLQSGQTLIGGGESIQVQLADGSTTNFLLSGTNGTIDGDPGVTTVTLASGVTIRDLTIQGGTTVIGGNAVSNFTLTDLSIQNATDGIVVTGAVNASVSNISFSGITGTSLFLNNESATVSNITIDGGTNGLVIANNTGTTTLSGINVSNVSGDALSFTNNTGDINVSGFTATNTGDDAIAVTGGGTFGFSGTTTLNGLGAGATSDGIDLSNTNNATLTFGDVDVTGLGGGTGLNMAGADATLTMQSLDVTGTGVGGSKGVDLSGTQNGRTVSITNGGTITNVDVGLVLGTNGSALAAPDAVFTWGGGDIGGLAYALDGIGVNAANGSYAFGTTGFTGAFNFTTSGTPNYFVAATATGTGDGSSTANRASVATAIADAAGLGTVNFILINDGSALDTAGATFELANNQTIDTFGGGRTFTSAGLIIAANITGTNLPTGTTAITDPTGNGAATLTNSSGAVSTIEVANGNTIRNITLGSTLGMALSGSGIAGLTIEGVTIGTGTDTPVNGIELNNTTGAVTLTNVDITNTTGTGLSLNGAKGTVTGNNVDITGANALSVTGGDAAVSFNASSSITNTSGTAVSISGRIGGSFTHFGSIASNGGSTEGISITGAGAASNVTFGGQVSLGTSSALGFRGVFVNNNGQSSQIAFTGGLEIETGALTGFEVRNGGSISVAAAGTRTIRSGGATAFFLQNTSIGSDGVNFDSIEAVGSGPFPGIVVSSVDTNAGGISIGSATLSGNTLRAIDLENVSGANGFSLTAADIDQGVGGTGVFIGGTNGTISIGTGTANGITGLKIDDGDQGVRIDQTSGTVNLGTTSTGVVEIGTTAQLNAFALQVGTDAGGTINIGNTTNQSRFDAAFNAVASYDADATTTFTNISAESQTSTAVVVVDNDGVGETRFESGLAISTTGGTGISIQSARASVASAPGLNTLNATGTGVGMVLNNATIGTAGLHFDTVNIATNSIGISIAGTTGGGDIVLGDVDINGTNTGTQAIRIAGTVSNTITIADFDTNLLQGQTALDIDGAYSGTMTFGDFDVTSSSTTGTTGIDLANATGGGTVQVGDTTAAGASASIAGVDTGVLLGNGTDLAFVYGDGEGAIDQGSTISATTAIDATNAPVAGTYNFQDVEFAGSPGAGFGIGTVYFVDSDGATGGGDGSGSSAANPMTLAAAELAAGAGDIIVLIDNGSPISTAATNANDTLNLLASQQLLSFGDGAGGSQSIQVSLTVPPTIQLFAAGLTIDDPTGGGAATLTTTASNDVVTLGGDGIRMSGIDFEGNGTAARAINDAGGATGTVIERSGVSNFATVGIEITPSINTTIDDVDFSGNANDILLNATNSTLTNITSTGASGTSITLTDATGTTTLTNISITGAANGLVFNNASGTVTATNVDISGGNTLSIDDGDAVFSFDAASSINATGGTAVSISNRSGGSFTHAGSVVANGAGTAGIFSFASTGAHSISFTGTVDIGTTTPVTSSGVFIDNTGQNVTVNFADIDIETDAGFGMVVQNGGTLSVGTGSLSVNNAQITNFAGIAFGAGGVNFTSITGTNLAGAAGLGFNSVTGGAFTVSGTTSIAGSTGSAIAATNVSANMQFGTVDLTLTSGDGLLLNGNGGTLTTGDMTIAMGTGGNGIVATGTNGDMTFGNVDITNVGAGTGVNLSGGTFDGQITFATLDITGTNTVGSKGIDLTGYDNSKDVVTTGSGTIQGVQTGIDLTNSDIANGVRFQYGDGSAPVASLIDTSGIAGNVAIVTTGVTATGEYDFEDVGFGASNISNLQGPTFFVVGTGGTSGNGTFSDPGTIAEAKASGAGVIVLVDETTGGVQHIIDAAAQGDGTLNLADGQALVGMVAGETVDASTLGISASGPPASVLLTGISSSSDIVAPGTGIDSVVPILTTTGANNTVELAGTSTIQTVDIRNGGTGDGITASFGAAHTATLRSSSIGGGTGAWAIDLATTAGASTAAFSDLTLTSGLRLDGSGGGSLSGTMTGTNTIVGATGQAVALNAVTLDPGGMTFDTISANGGGTVGNGIVLDDLGSGSSFSVTGTTTLDNYTGFGIEIGNLSQATQTISFGAVNINTTVGEVDSGGDGISIDTISATDVDIDFGTVSIGNATDPSGTGAAVATITNAATGFDLDFASLDLANVALGFTVDGFDAPGASTVTVAGPTNITANTFDAIRIVNSDGDVTFGGRTTITNSGAAAGADGVDLGADAGGANTGAYTFNGVDITVNGTGAFGFRATDSGTVTINDPSSNNQITSNNGTALYINPTQISLDLQSVTSSNATGSGVFIDGGDAVGGAGATAVDIGTLNVTDSSGAGVRITNSTGTFNIGATTINNAGSAGGGVDLDLGAGDTATVNFTGALDIDTNAATGFDANGTGGASLTVNVSGTGTQAINTATGQILSMNQVIVGGSGVSFDTLAASSTVSGDAVRLFDVDGGAFNGGAVSVANTSAAGDGIVISGFSTSTFNFTSATIDGAAGAGINLSGANGAVTFGTVDIDGTDGDGVEISNAHSSVTISGGSIGATNDPAGIAVDINGGSANVTIAATVTKTTANDLIEISGRSAGTVTFSGNLSATGAAGGIQVIANNNGTINFSGGTKTLSTGTNTAVSLTNNTGTAINFIGGGLDIDTTSGAGFVADNSGTVTVQGPGNTVTTNTGTAVDIQNTTIGGDGVTFDTLSATGTVTGDAISLTSVSGGTFNGGAVSVAGASDDGVVLTNNAATIQFGTTGITNAAGDGIEISGSGATFGATTIINPGARGIVIGTTAGTTFGDVDITNLADNTTGVDLTSASGAVNFATLDISSASLTTGTTGIDLTGATNASNMTTTNSSTINNLAVGVDLTNANITGTFQYGDGEGATNTNSNISNTTTAIVITGVTANGTYNFEDVAFPGSGTSNLGGGGGGGTVYWVAATPTGAEDGSSAANAASIADAETASANYIVLLDNAGGGGQDTINLGSGDFALDTDQSLLSFRNVDSFTFGGGAPSNIELTGISGGTTITNPNTGSGAPLLTSGGTTTITVADGSVIDGLHIENTSNSNSGERLIGADDFAGTFTVQNSLLEFTGFSGIGVDITHSGGFSGTTVALIDNNQINTNNRQGIRIELQGTGRLDATISNNTIVSTGAGDNINALVGFLTPATLCADISGNTVSGATDGIVFNVVGSGGSEANLLLPGFTGPANDSGSARTFLDNQNSITASTDNVDVVLNNGLVPANPGACTTP
ncbi:S-layer family protein [Stappia stellulata]|uniref:S-layer family protein n=1 Tax=Stappia stellulata TaxID=71235 RepID=UPI000406D284|nr:S-layer family protein [Stappia stellulata]